MRNVGHPVQYIKWARALHDGFLFLVALVQQIKKNLGHLNVLEEITYLLFY